MYVVVLSQYLFVGSNRQWNNRGVMLVKIYRKGMPAFFIGACNRKLTDFAYLFYNCQAQPYAFSTLIALLKTLEQFFSRYFEVEGRYYLS